MTQFNWSQVYFAINRSVWVNLGRKYVCLTQLTVLTFHKLSFDISEVVVSEAMCGLRAICLFLVGVCLAPPPLPPPPISPRVGKLLLDLELNQYNNLLTEEEIDLPVLAQLSEEQLSRIGIRTMGQRVRIINAAQQAMAASQTVIENVVEDQPEVDGREEQEYVDGVEGEEDVEGLEEEGGVEGGEVEDDVEGGEADAGEEEEDAEAEAPFEYEIVTKTTTTGRKTHVIFVGDNKYLSRGIKKNGQAFFYCNFVSVHHKCTSSFRVRYHDLGNPMDEIPEVETQPSPHVTTDGVAHLPDKVKRRKENMNEKICEAIRVDPLRPIREIHEECLNNVLHGIDDAEERIEFCQQMPTFRQCERNERRFRNRLIPPNPPTARDIRTDGIFTLDPETGINTICFDDQGEADHDRIIALSHPEVQRYVKNVEYRF